MVVSWITRSLSPQFAQSILYIDNARDLWLNLKERFSKGDHFRASDLLQQIHSMRHGDLNVSSFFTNMRTLWEELDSLRPPPPCTCPTPSACSLVNFIDKSRENEHIICFLKGLNDSYNSVKTQILLMEPLPSINKVFSLVLQQEHQHNGSILGEPPSLALQFNNNNQSKGQVCGFQMQGRGRGRGSLKCTHYGRINHTIETCYLEHGFPPGYRSRFNPATTNFVASDDSTQNPSDSVNASQPSGTGVQLTAEQLQHLLALLPSSKTDTPHSTNQVHTTPLEVSTTQSAVGKSPSLSTWILDTGATDHVCNDLPKIFWSYAVSHAIHLINRLPSLTLQHKSPFELLYN